MEIKKMVEEILNSRIRVQEIQQNLREMEGELKQELISKGMVELLNINYGALHRRFIRGGEKKKEVK